MAGKFQPSTPNGPSSAFKAGTGGLPKKRKKGFKGISAFEERLQDKKGSGGTQKELKSLAAFANKGDEQAKRALEARANAGDKTAKQMIRNASFPGGSFETNSEIAKKQKARAAFEDSAAGRKEIDAEASGASSSGFPKKIGKEDPTSDDFSDAAGMPPLEQINSDNADIAETVLAARKEYLAAAKKAGSDTSEADAQVKDLESKVSQRKSRSAPEKRPLGSTKVPGTKTKRHGTTPRPKQPKGTRSSKSKGLPVHGPLNKGARSSNKNGNWRKQPRDPRTGKWI